MFSLVARYIHIQHLCKFVLISKRHESLTHKRMFFILFLFSGIRIRRQVTSGYEIAYFNSTEREGRAEKNKNAERKKM